MNKFSKILSISILLAASLYADDNTIVEFEKKRISQNPNVQIKDAKINTKKELPLAGWYGYILDVEANVQGKTINAKDILFSDGKYISLDLYDATNGKSLKDLVTPNLSDKYHDDAKLIAGNKNAKDKITNHLFTNKKFYCHDKNTVIPIPKNSRIDNEIINLIFN